MPSEFNGKNGGEQINPEIVNDICCIGGGVVIIMSEFSLLTRWIWIIKTTTTKTQQQIHDAYEIIFKVFAFGCVSGVRFPPNYQNKQPKQIDSNNKHNDDRKPFHTIDTRYVVNEV